jgi:uncharacterized protein (UPF0332 family)
MTSDIHQSLRAAQSHLEAAQFCYEQEQDGLAASEAYYTMYHAVRAWSLRERGEAPRSHKGMGMILYEHLVGSDLVQWHKQQFDRAFQSRRRWHYKGLGPDPDADLADLLAAAGEMIEETS